MKTPKNIHVDRHEVPVFVLDALTGSAAVPHKPRITIWTDAATRAVVGWQVDRDGKTVIAPPEGPLAA